MLHVVDITQALAPSERAAHVRRDTGLKPLMASQPHGFGEALNSDSSNELWSRSHEQKPTCRISSSIFKGQGCALKASRQRFSPHAPTCPHHAPTIPNIRNAIAHWAEDLQHLRHHHADLQDLGHGGSVCDEGHLSFAP